ncbi:hypothetical protein DIURU_005308 [Diutina rugosa]|uniref:Golgi SNAP receptor complex member 1 n=1 Tax=Diutina rugosa TaxID=5481 RepID=A0A642UE02_DIURU|nr:uncharacterized protein DIURU_005308 [Diutina rugosa]KAA8897331.1 hypothetical protein DIURU_005308 [Diutina rugosa]
MSFAQLRSQALSLEKQTESLLSKYSKFQADVGESTGESADEAATKLQLHDVLAKRDEVVARLAVVSDSESVSTSKLQQLTRHREVLADHRRSAQRIESALQEHRQRNNLMFSVHSGLEAHRQRNAQDREGLNATDYALDERQRVDGANSLADRLLQSAYETREELWAQRQYLQSAQQRMMGTLASVPGINTLISKIGTRRKRDTIILATVIAVCIILLVWL